MNCLGKRDLYFSPEWISSRAKPYVRKIDLEKRGKSRSKTMYDGRGRTLQATQRTQLSKVAFKKQRSQLLQCCSAILCNGNRVFASLNFDVFLANARAFLRFAGRVTWFHSAWHASDSMKLVFGNYITQSN